MKYYLILSLFLIFSACKPASDSSDKPESNSSTSVDSIEKTVATKPEKPKPSPYLNNKSFIDVKILDPTVILDMRYATTNNFVEEQMYDCGRCLLRPEVAEAIVKIHQSLKSRGLGGVKFFDCYRPRPVQQKLWDKVPDPRYVTNPKKGSMHNRGAAIDLTIVYADGRELDMGTEFDFFGKEAYHDYTDHSEEIADNRTLLKGLMEDAGFKSIRTEWWHYSYQATGGYEISDYLWDCE